MIDDGGIGGFVLAVITLATALYVIAAAHSLVTSRFVHREAKGPASAICEECRRDKTTRRIEASVREDIESIRAAFLDLASLLPEMLDAPEPAQGFCEASDWLVDQFGDYAEPRLNGALRQELAVQRKYPTTGVELAVRSKLLTRSVSHMIESNLHMRAEYLAKLASRPPINRSSTALRVTPALVRNDLIAEARRIASTRPNYRGA